MENIDLGSIKDTSKNVNEERPKNILFNDLDEEKAVTNHDPVKEEVDFKRNEHDDEPFPTNPQLYGESEKADEDLALIDNFRSKDIHDEKMNLDMKTKEELHTKTDKLIELVDGLWECKTCAKTSVRKIDAKRHTEIHLTSITHACTLCGKTLRTSNSLMKHVQYVHADPDASMVCNICGKSGMNRTRFQNHVKYHSAGFKN